MPDGLPGRHHIVPLDGPVPGMTSPPMRSVLTLASTLPEALPLPPKTSPWMVRLKIPELVKMLAEEVPELPTREPPIFTVWKPAPDSNAPELVP